jgi:hypothetical protein
VSDTLTAPPYQARAQRPRRLRGTAWLAWRQNRALLIVAFFALLAFSFYLLKQQATVSHDIAVLRGSGCGPGNTRAARCLSGWLSGGDDAVGFENHSEPLLAALPALIGMFVGAPLLALEYERGTNRLAWVQSLSRSRWVAVRLWVPAAVVLVFTSVVALLAHWVWQTDQSMQAVIVNPPPFQGLTYPVIGVTAVAMALFALALGTVMGMLLRRTLLAVGVTGALVVAAEFGLHLLRPQLWPQDYGVQTHAYGAFAPPADAWLISTGTVMPDGSRIPSGDCGHNAACLAAKTVYGYYQPASHFWPIQYVESGILLAAALALVLFAHRWTRRSAA